MSSVRSTPEQPAVVAPTSDERVDVRYERKMGNSELSYYLPSRANGVNDMCVLGFLSLDLSPGASLSLFLHHLRYLHLGFKAPTHIMKRERVRVAWAIFRQRHPSLAATVEMHDYDDVRFV